MADEDEVTVDEDEETFGEAGEKWQMRMKRR